MALFHVGIDLFCSFYRHNDSKAAVKDFGSSFAADEQDVFPLQIRLSVSQETNSLLVKISLEVNFVFCSLFSFGPVFCLNVTFGL